MKLRDKAALSLDSSLNAATNMQGIYTDKARNILSAYLDGAVKLRSSTVRAHVKYLMMVSK